MKKVSMGLFRLSDLVMQLCSEIKIIVLLAAIAFRDYYNILVNAATMILKSMKAKVNTAELSLNLFISVFDLVKHRVLSLRMVIFSNTSEIQQVPT